jgi:hypothetical protein
MRKGSSSDEDAQTEESQEKAAGDLPLQVLPVAGSSTWEEAQVPTLLEAVGQLGSRVSGETSQ